MSQFSFNDYQNVVAQAEANSSGSTKIGYFKLKDDGDIAIARLNVGSTEDLMFASVHTIGINGKWIKVNCLNPLGSYGGDCALCSANAANPKGAISKSNKKLFIPMLVSYRDPQSATGYTPAVPVIWDRPAAFSRELANKLMIAGDLRNTLVLITRNGKAGDMQTTYSMDILPAEHPVFKPDMISTDFSAFNGFNIAKHSYWEKTPAEINAFLTTGKFPEAIQTNNGQTASSVATAAQNTAVFGANSMPAQPTQPMYQAPTQVPPVAPVSAPAPTIVPNTAPEVTPNAVPNIAPTAPVDQPAAGTPSRNFSGFSF